MIRLTSLILILLACLAPVLQAGATPAPSSEENFDRARHLLNRITYGPREGDLEQVTNQGINNYLDQQLHPQAIQVPQALISLRQSTDEVNKTPIQIFLQYVRPVQQSIAKQRTSGQPADPVKMVATVYKQMYTDITKLRLSRALYSPRQLEELMVDFWYNHFNVSMDKGLDYAFVGGYEETAIRPNAMGKFRDLLGATAHHAAMLFYLDNTQNSAPNKTSYEFGGQNKSTGLNENYARELMELHTLGVDGGYSQKDVVQLAKILTGLGLPRPNGQGGNRQAILRSPFGDYFDQSRHDYSDKVLLGHVIKGRGEAEIEEALDILAAHPSTAHHISYQLAQYFVADKPPAALVDRMQKTYLSTGGDITTVLQTLFYSSEFWDPQYRKAKFKSPYRYVISSLRACNAHPGDFRALLYFMNQAGEPLYRCLTPDGYKNTEEAWLNSDALINRLSFATALGLNKLPSITTNVEDPAEVLAILGPRTSATTQHAIDSAPRQLQLSLFLGSPEFMRY